jgi:hypothetical protein
MKLTILIEIPFLSIIFFLVTHETQPDPGYACFTRPAEFCR